VLYRRQHVAVRSCGVPGSECHEAFTVKRLKIGSDDSIWQHAEKLQAVVISKDSDYLPHANQFSKAQFIHVRGGNMTTSQLIERFRVHLPEIPQALKSGEKIIDIK
jgi:predicted nuclease of predicted toxin-antitoxin system